MRRTIVLTTLNAALLLSTSVMAADAVAPAPLAAVVEDEQSGFKLSINGGVTAFGIPDTDNAQGRTDFDDTLFNGLDDPLYGGSIGIDMSAPLNSDGAALNASGFATYVTRSGYEDHALDDGQNLFVLHGPSLPSGVINLDNEPNIIIDAGDATSVVTPTGPLDVDSASQTALIGPVYEVGTGDDGFSYAGVNGDDQTFAIGALATKDGVIFVGSGELDGLKTSSDITQNLAYAGGDLTFSQSSAPGSSMTVTGYVGPSIRYLGTETTTDIKVRQPINPYNEEAFEYPTFEMNTVENIDTYYGGAVAGANFDLNVWDGATFSFGGGVGVYYASSSYASDTEASMSGGTNTSGLDESVTSHLDLDPVDGFAYTVKADSKFSADIAHNVQINFGFGAEYMSRVATSRFVGTDGVTSSGTDVVDIDADADYDSTTATGHTELAFGDAWSAKATIGLTGQF